MKSLIIKFRIFAFQNTHVSHLVSSAGSNFVLHILLILKDHLKYATMTNPFVATTWRFACGKADRIASKTLGRCGLMCSFTAYATNPTERNEA